MQLKVGTRLKGPADDTQVIVVRAPVEEVEVSCGGHALVALEADVEGNPAVEPGHEGPTLLGKRYVDNALGLELLVTKPGNGALYVNGAALVVKEAKPLPSSE